MKNNISILSWIIRFLIGLCCFVWFGKTDLWAEKTPRQVDTIKLRRMAEWKEKPHSLQFGYGISMYSEGYTYYSHKPLSRFSLDYTFNLRWKPARVNFFVTGSLAYDGDLRNNRHYSLDRFHLSAGIGFNVRLTYFLNLSVAYSPGFCYEDVLVCYHEIGNTGNHTQNPRRIDLDYRGLLSVRLTGEVKNIRIGIGFEDTHCAWFPRPDYLLSLSVGYRF